MATPKEATLRVAITVVQDEATNLLLAYDIAETESRDGYRRALCDAFTRYGIPNRCRFDNTRAAANKTLTAGAKNRFRFTDHPDDLPGLLPKLQVEVVFTKPYNGRSKLVERLFAELKERSEKHPALAGAYTGRSPTEKPANYGAAAADLLAFRRVFAEAVEHYNARTDRRSKVAFKTSHRAVFEAGIVNMPVRRLTAEQRRYFFTDAVRRKVSPSGTIRLGKEPHVNRFGCDRLRTFVGRDVVARFDPADLAAPIIVETIDGRLIDDAVPCIEKRGFNSRDDARAYERENRRRIRATKEAADALGRMSLLEVQAALPAPEPEAPAPVIQPKVVGGYFRNKPRQQLGTGFDADVLDRAMRRDQEIRQREAG